MKFLLSLVALVVLAIGCDPPAPAKGCPLVAVNSFAAVACPSVAVQSFAYVQPQVQVQTFAVQQQVVQAQAVAFAPVCVQAVAFHAHALAVCPSGGCASGQRAGILSRVLGSRSRSVARSRSVSR